MASSRPSLKRSLLLSAFFAVSLFSSDVFAQATTAQTTAQTTPATTPRTTAASTQRTTTPASNSRSTSRQDPVSLPPLGDSSSVAAITDLPTLDNPGAAPIPTYPAAAVPDTQHAPFMNHSTLPDGTVFIAVGAILAAFGLTVIVWRGIVACLLHRSVERASKAQHIATDKAANFGAPPHAYSFNERDSSPVHGSAAALLTGRPPKKSHKTGMPTATPSQTNLFFSPTAAPGAGGLGGSRDTRFLPSGFYASASAPSHNGSNSISMSTLRPSSRGRMGMGPSPPDSPLIAPRRDFSSSSLSLSTPSNLNNGRAPSAFLDDLLDDQQGGGAPHPQGPPQQQYNTPQRYPSGPDGQYYSHSPSPPGHRGY